MPAQIMRLVSMIYSYTNLYNNLFLALLGHARNKVAPEYQSDVSTTNPPMKGKSGMLVHAAAVRRE
jgi:hypothetical protein